MYLLKISRHDDSKDERLIKLFHVKGPCTWEVISLSVNTFTCITLFTELVTGAEGKFLKKTVKLFEVDARKTSCPNLSTSQT